MEKKISLSARLSKYLSIAEQGLLAALIISMVLTILHVDSSVIIYYSLIGLAIVFFLNAYRPLNSQRAEDEKFIFTDLLTTTILPKVMWISCAVSVIGILFYIRHFEAQSYKNMLIIGGGSLLLGVLTAGFFMLGKVKSNETLQAVLLRAIPMLVMDIYIFMK
jgi:hypothetical protein